PGGLALGWLGLWPWYVVLGLLSFVLLLFPSGQLASRRWRPGPRVAPAAPRSIGWAAAFAARPLEGLGSTEVINPLGIQGTETVFEVLGTVVAALGVVMIFAAAAMGGRFR